MKQNVVQRRTLDSFVSRASNIVKNRSSKDVRLTPLDNIAKRQLCLFVRKCLDGTLPENFHDYFELVQHRIRTRNNGIPLQLPKVRTEYGKRAVRFLGAMFYNDLPIYVRKETNFTKFKNSLKQYFN